MEKKSQRFNPVCRLNDWSILAAENSGARVLATPEWVDKMECHERLEALEVASLWQREKDRFPEDACLERNTTESSKGWAL